MTTYVYPAQQQQHQQPQQPQYVVVQPQTQYAQEQPKRKKKKVRSQEDEVEAVRKLTLAKEKAKLEARALAREQELSIIRVKPVNTEIGFGIAYILNDHFYLRGLRSRREGVYRIKDIAWLYVAQMSVAVQNDTFGLRLGAEVPFTNFNDAIAIICPYLNAHYYVYVSESKLLCFGVAAGGSLMVCPDYRSDEYKVFGGSLDIGAIGVVTVQDFFSIKFMVNFKMLSYKRHYENSKKHAASGISFLSMTTAHVNASFNLTPKQFLFGVGAAGATHVALSDY